MRKMKNRIAINASVTIIRIACLLPPFSVFLAINTTKCPLSFRGPRDVYFVIDKEQRGFSKFFGSWKTRFQLYVLLL